MYVQANDIVYLDKYNAVQIDLSIFPFGQFYI
jgi:hypothetical protein